MPDSPLPETPASPRARIRARFGRTTIVTALAVVTASGLAGTAMSRRSALPAAAPAPMMMFAPGDTVFLYGTKTMTAPASGGPSLYVDQFVLDTPNFNKRYVLYLQNGTGTTDTVHRVRNARVTINGWLVWDSTAFTNAPATLQQIVDLVGTNTVNVSVTGPVGTSFRLSVIAIAQPNVTIFGPTNVVRGSTGTFTTQVNAFTLPIDDTIPYTLFIRSGNFDSTNRAHNVTLALNGTTLVQPADMASAVALVKSVTILPTDTLVTTLTGGNAGDLVRLWITAGVKAGPTITFTSPVAGFATRTPSATLAATMGKKTGATTTATLNGVAITLDANAKFTTPVTLTKYGTNNFTVAAQFSTGGKSSSTWPIVWDTLPPVMTVTAPAQSLHTKTTPTPVTGSFTDITAVTVKANATSVTVTGSTFSGTVPLVTGTNTITITGTDKAANASSVVRTVVLDQVPPVLTVTTPAIGLITNAASINVTGTATDVLSTVTLKVNNVAVTLGTGGSFTKSVALNVGSNTITTVATDAANNVTTVTRTVIRDATPPAVVVASPTDSQATNLPQFVVRGTATDANGILSVTVNGTLVTLDASNTFSRGLTLASGNNTVSVVATDKAGNVTTVNRTAILDSVAPTLSVTTPADGFTTTAQAVSVTGSIADQTKTTVTANGAVLVLTGNNYSGSIALATGTNSVQIAATDKAGNRTNLARLVIRQSTGSGGSVADAMPLDTAVHAPVISMTRATSMQQATSFLYTGTGALQSGVTPGTIDRLKGAAVRGRVLDRAGNPVAGVTVAVLGHPEFGSVLTRASGQFDMALNGGRITLVYSKAGVLPVQRTLNVEWGGFSVAPEVVVVPLDPQVATINFSTPIQVAQGSAQSDAEGTRHATLFFRQGTTATMTLPGGGTQPLSVLNVRATEYTVGGLGPKAMPADLPPTSSYTYAVELSSDEAIAAGATTVTFSQPVSLYVENFIGFPVGMTMPVGYYDRAKAAWLANPNGLVVEILSVTGGKADLDVTGTGAAASPAALAALGITDPERQQLATSYAVGQSLWRAPTTHFSPADLNLPALPKFPTDHPIQPRPKDKPEDCKKYSSIIGCQSQSLSEAMPVAGTDFALVYKSTRSSANATLYSIDIPLTPPTSDSTLQRVDLSISIAGRKLTQSFAPAPSLHYLFTWDGRDAYGRQVQGERPATISVAYVYPAIFTMPASSGSSFGLATGNSLFMNGQSYVLTRTASMAALTTRFVQRLGTWDARGEGFGGWTLTVHHSYDPSSATLSLGTGERTGINDVNGMSILTVGGSGPPDTGSFAGDGGPVTQARFNWPRKIAFAPDGSYYVVDVNNHVIRRVATDGTISTFAGRPGQSGFAGDSGPALSAKLSSPRSVAVGPDGSVYINDFLNYRIRRVQPGGMITTYAGGGTIGSGNGDGGKAKSDSCKLNVIYDIATGPDGSLYLAERSGNRVRRIGPDSIIRTFAGSGNSFADSIPALTATMFNPEAVTVGPDGSVYIASSARVRRVGPDGILINVAGTGASPPLDAGLYTDGPATAIPLGRIGALDAAPDGAVYVQALGRVYRLSGGGFLTAVAGNGLYAGFSGDGGPPVAATLNGPWPVVAPDGSLYIADQSNNRIRRVAASLPGVAGSDIAIASNDGGALFVFDSLGRHLRTVDTHTNVVLYSFAYDTIGYLTTITDADSGVTTISRDPTGKPLAITASSGQATAMGIDAAGYLGTLTYPGGQSMRFTYSGGLLTTLTDPVSAVHTFSYDSLGRVVRDADATGGSQTLVRTTDSISVAVSVTTQLGRTTTYLADVDSMGVPQSTVIDPAGLRTVSWSSMAHGYTNLYAPDGTISSYAFAADPRFGAQAPAIDTAMVTTPFGLVTTFGMLKSVVLAQAGNALSLVSETETRTTNGLTSIRRYDAVAHTYTATSPEGRTRLDSLDGRGRLVLRRAPGLAAFLMSYDAKGRLASVRQGSRLLQYAYDARGNLASTTDPIGKVTSFSYDAADRVVSKQRPDSSVISFGYDLTGSVASITPPGRSPHTFTYSLNGEVTSYVPPSVGGLATPTTYSYDADHSLTRMIRGDGATIDFSYDAAGRAIRLTTPQGQYATTYDAAGKVRTTSTPGGSVETIDYDAQLPIQDAWTGPVWGYITFGLDDRHQLTSLVIDGIDSASFQYDRDGMLIAAGDLIVSRDAGNALVTGLTLGSLATGDRLDSLGAVQSESVSVAGAALFQRSYARDSAGRIALVTETVQGVVTTIGYAYDAAGRLAQVTRNGSVVSSYQYDANGNRVLAVGSSGSVVGTYDAQDRLAAYGTTSFTYTPNGELFQRITPVDTSTYSYDNFGNLTRVKIPGKQIDYILDAQGRRIGRKLNGAKVQGFLYVGPDAPVAQLDAFDNIVSVFIYARHLNVPDYMVKGGVEYQLITDQLGSVRLVVNATTGQVVQRIDYDEFGAITANTNPGFQPFGFAGGLYDDDSKLVHFRTREYDPRTGRWTTKDPILFGGGSANLYTYIDNDPVNAVDADGEMPIFLAVALIGGAIDAIAGAIEYWDCGGTVAAKHAGIQFAAGFLGAMAAEYLISKGRLDIAAKVGAAVEALVRDALEVMLTGEHVNAIKVAETVAEEVIENVVFTMGAERVSKWATPQRGRKPFRLAPRPRKDWTEGPIDDATRKATESVVKDEADWLKKFLKRCPVDCKL